MSYLTDKLRAPYREAQGEVTVPGQMLDDIVAANPERRTLLKNSFGLSMLSVFGASTLLTACGGDDDDDDTPANGGDGDGAAWVDTVRRLGGNPPQDDIDLALVRHCARVAPEVSRE